MKKLIILSLLLLATPVYAAPSWETGGNSIAAGQVLGTTNVIDLSIIRGGIEKLRVTADGLRFMNPLSYLSDSNGQVFMNHLTSGGTAIYAFNGTRMVNLTANGVEIVGNLIARTAYTIAPTSSSYYLSATDYTVELESGEFMLPPAVLMNQGKHYELINTGYGDIPVRVDTGQFIGNKDPEAEYRIQAGSAVTVVSNGTTWRVLP